MMEETFDRFPQAFVRLKGRNGYTREFLAILDAASDCSFVPKVDAYRLGFTDTAFIEGITRPPNFASFVTSHGYAEGAVITMAEVGFGPFTLPDVEFISYDLDQITRYDVLLGSNFLQSFKLEIDYGTKKFVLTKVR